MINGRRIISAVICGLFVQSAVRANMILVSIADTEREQPYYVYNRLDIQHLNSTRTYNFPQFTNLDIWSGGFSSQANTDTEESSDIQNLQIFTTNGPGSLNLCLSALLGLGLCSSAHFVKKLSFNIIPEWYHNGGPFQIGHSQAVTPESLCSVAVFCFIQPIFIEEDCYTHHCLKTIVSIWRKSQFTPAVMASRAPPLTP